VPSITLWGLRPQGRFPIPQGCFPIRVDIMPEGYIVPEPSPALPICSLAPQG
jgi:hypothetical protein